MKRRGRYHLVDTRIAVFIFVPTVPQIITQQVVQTVEQVPVFFVFYPSFRIGHLSLGLDSVFVFCLVYQVFRQFAAPQLAFWLTFDTSSQAAIVASIEPNRSKLRSDDWSARSSMMMTESFQNRNVPATLLIWQCSSSTSPHCLMTMRIVFHVDSFRLFKVLRTTTARISGKRIQLLTSHTLETNDLPPPATPPPNSSCGIF